MLFNFSHKITAIETSLMLIYSTIVRVLDNKDAEKRVGRIEALPAETTVELSPFLNHNFSTGKGIVTSLCLQEKAFLEVDLAKVEKDRTLFTESRVFNSPVGVIFLRIFEELKEDP